MRLASPLPQIAVLSRPARGLLQQIIISFKPYYYFIRSMAENTTALKFNSFYHVVFFHQGETVASRGKQSFAPAKAAKQQRARRFGLITLPRACRSGGDLPGCRMFLRRLLLQGSGSESHLCGWHWIMNSQWEQSFGYFAMLIWPHGAEQQARRITQSIQLNVVLPKWFQHIQMEEVSVIFGEQSTNSIYVDWPPQCPDLNPSQLI